MTVFGETQLFNSGVKFYRRYHSLARQSAPFIRASGSSRVIASAEKFISGFQDTKVSDPKHEGDGALPAIGAVITEGKFNNTLDHGGCPKFESNHSKGAHKIQDRFLNIFGGPVLKRIQQKLPGVNISLDDIPSLMDMCPFHTISSTPDASTLSPFCTLFTDNEWKQYDYYQSLGKYYGYGAGNSLGPSQGIGFTNELISRLTNKPVRDFTSVNHTLDSEPSTFPLNNTLYADFSHDNTMTSIYMALGLYNATNPLSHTDVETTDETDGYSASWTTPFGAMAYIEKMECDSTPVANEPLVRVLVNDRVVPLHGCPVDMFGRCKLVDFVKGLSFARSGGQWNECYD